MFAYIVRRLLSAILLLLIVTAITFAIFFLVPRLAGQSVDDLAARYAGRDITPAVLAGIKAKLGFDKPLIVQYWDFIKGLVVGAHYDTGADKTFCPPPCFGYSFRNNVPVWHLLVTRAPVTFSIAIGAAVLWLLGGVTTGVISALRKGSIADRLSMGMALAGVSLPIFFTGLLSLDIFAYNLHIFPVSQYTPFTQNPLEWAYSLVLPWVTLAFLYAAMYARLTRAGMLETLSEDYIRTARAKGLPERTVIVRHALRATLTPIITIFGLDLGLLLGGAVLTEYTYSLQGLGRLAIDGINQSDLPVVLGVVMATAFFVVLANLAVDVLYAVADPRVRLT